MCYRLNDLHLLRDVYADEKYILGVNLMSRQLRVVLRRDSDVMEQLQAAFQAEVINILAEQYSLSQVPSPLL